MGSREREGGGGGGAKIFTAPDHLPDAHKQLSILYNTLTAVLFFIIFSRCSATLSFLRSGY